MTLKQLLSDLQKIDKYLKNKWPKESNDVKTLGRLVKIQEELGELSDEVLSHLGAQREDKLDKYNSEDISKELVDVLFATILLGIYLDLDIEESVNRRMKTIKKRFKIK